MPSDDRRRQDDERRRPREVHGTSDWRLERAGGEAMTPGAEDDEDAVRDLCRLRSVAAATEPRPEGTEACSAPTAMPIRNSARMIVNTYVELPVPAARSRFQTHLVAERREPAREREQERQAPLVAHTASSGIAGPVP